MVYICIHTFIYHMTTFLLVAMSYVALFIDTFVYHLHNSIMCTYIYPSTTLSAHDNVLGWTICYRLFIYETHILPSVNLLDALQLPSIHYFSKVFTPVTYMHYTVTSYRWLVCTKQNVTVNYFSKTWHLSYCIPLHTPKALDNAHIIHTFILQVSCLSKPICRGELFVEGSMPFKYRGSTYILPISRLQATQMQRYAICLRILTIYKCMCTYSPLHQCLHMERN